MIIKKLPTMLRAAPVPSGDGGVIARARTLDAARPGIHLPQLPRRASPTSNRPFTSGVTEWPLNEPLEVRRALPSHMDHLCGPATLGQFVSRVVRIGSPYPSHRHLAGCLSMYSAGVNSQCLGDLVLFGKGPVQS
ncbi:hypothetical protein [Streptomyces sp. SAS_272]|uniref:hypothetical protein n=1 Tax=Streptomyces sp. SAS_272 TaxID=3412747 RepID=UPI00403D208B